VNWIQTSDDVNKILWLHGPAEAGKSAIAQTIAERCTVADELVASFFFSRGKPGHNRTNLLWATVAFHIAKNIPCLRSPIGGAVAADPDVFHKDLDTQLLLLIVEPFLSVGHIPINSPFLVVIDGLDECEDEDEQRAVLSSISRIINIHKLPLRFFICYRISLDASFKPGYGFLRTESNKIYERHQHVMRPVSIPRPTKNTVQLFTDRSGGQTIYASTVLKSIDDDGHRPTDQLEAVLRAYGPTASTEVDRLYQEILSTSTDVPLLLRILGCIFVATRPLSASEIETLLN
jgi:hypothetical protein